MVVFPDDWSRWRWQRSRVLPISQFHISTLSDAGGGKDMHSAIVRERVNKVLQPVSVVYVKDLIFDFPEFCDIFLQLGYPVEWHVKKHLAVVICRGSILVERLDKIMPELVVHQGETVKSYGVEVETACFASKETE